VSQRRACSLVLLHRAGWYYRHRKRDDAALRMRLRELAAARPRFGYNRLHILLRREGQVVNLKRVRRIYREEGLNLRLRLRRRKRASMLRVVPAPPTRVNERWSMDFMMDTLLEGRRIRVLTVVDILSRFSPIIEADHTMNGAKVVAALERATKRHGCPAIIQVDNGSEFQSKALDAWAYAHQVKLDFIRPGKPVENGFIESFNARVRDECLNANVFVSLADARSKLDAWRRDYNESRPHTSLGRLTPAEYVRQQEKSEPQEIANLSV
jgi:putative transposase